MQKSNKVKFQVNNMLAFLNDASGSFATFIKEMNEKSSDEMTKQLLKSSMDTYQTHLGQTKAAFEVLAVTIGTMVLPTLKDMAILLNASATYLNNHASAIVGFVSFLAKLAGGYLMVFAAMKIWALGSAIFTGVSAALAGVAAALGGVALAEGAGTVATMAHNAALAIKNGLLLLATPLMAAYDAAVAAGGIASGIAAGGVALLSGALGVLEALLAPLTATVLAVVAVIALLGVVAYEVYENWETVSNDLTFIWNTLVDVFSVAVEAILIAALPIILQAYALTQIWIWAVKEVISPLLQFLGETFGAIFAWISDVLSSHGVTTERVASFISNIWNNLITWIANNISPRFAQFLNSMLEKLISFANKVFEIADKVRRAISSMFRVGTDAESAGDDKSFIDKVKGYVGLGEDSEMGKLLKQSEDMMKANSPYAYAPPPSTGTMPNELGGGGGAGSKGKGGKGAKGAKEADNSVEAILYRFLTKEKGLSHNRAIGELANVQALSNFDYKAGEGTDRRGLYGWDNKQWSEYEKWLAGTGYKDSAVSQINYKHTWAEKYDKEEKEKYQEYLRSGSSTPQEFAQAYSNTITKIGNIDNAIVDALDKRFAKKNGEENYSDPMKDMAERYKLLKAEFDNEINTLKTERGKVGQTVTAEEQLKIYEKMMGIGDNKNPFAYLEKAQKDYEKQLLEAAKYEAKRQESIRTATDNQVKAVEKMADAEVAFAEKLGLLNKSDVRKYEWDKNESNYAKNKPLADARLGATVALDRGTAEDMLEAYQNYVYAKDELEAEFYAKRMFYLSSDVEATKKALNEEFKLEQSYRDKRRSLNEEEFAYRARYVTTFIDSLTNGIQEGLEGILNRTKSFADAFRDIFKGVVQDIIKLFSKDFAERIHQWLSKAIFKQKETGNPAGSFADLGGILGGGKKTSGKSSGGGGAFDIVGWAQSSLSSLGGGMGKGKGKGNVLVNALGLNNFAASVKSAVQPGLLMLRNQAQLTVQGISNVSQQGMQMMYTGLQTGTQMMGVTYQGYKVTQVATEQMGNTAIVASSQSTAATVQATTAQMMGWLMAVLALFSLFGGGGGSSTSTSTSSVNLGRSPDSYYMTPTPVMQSTTFNVPSFDIGGNIERDMFAMVHKGEMVLTPEQANVIRETARNGGSMGNSGNANANVKSNITVSTVDSRGFDRVLRNYNRDLSKQVKKGIRNGYLTAKGLV